MPMRLLLILGLLMQSLAVRPSCDVSAAPSGQDDSSSAVDKPSCCCGDACPMSMPREGAVNAKCGCGMDGDQQKPTTPATSLSTERTAAPALLALPVALPALASCDIVPAAAADRPETVPACGLHVIHCIWMI